MSPARYYIIGSRAVKVLPQPDGRLEVVAYYPEEDEFRGAIWALDRVNGSETEEVTEQELDRIVEQQRAEAAADPSAQRRTRLDKLQQCRLLLVDAVRELDPARADALQARYGSRGKSIKAEERRTRLMMQEVGEIEDVGVRSKVGLVVSLTGLGPAPHADG